MIVIDVIGEIPRHGHWGPMGPGVVRGGPPMGGRSCGIWSGAHAPQPGTGAVPQGAPWSSAVKLPGLFVKPRCRAG